MALQERNVNEKGQLIHTQTIEFEREGDAIYVALYKNADGVI